MGPISAAPDPVNMSVSVSGTQRDTSVTFLGFASVDAFITIIDNGSVVGTTSANSVGSFLKTLTSQLAGTHSFSISVQDTSGRMAPDYSFIMNLQANAETVISNILLPTTIDVQVGERVRLFGAATPNTEITVFVHSNPVTETFGAGITGVWSHYINASLDPGDHTAYGRISTQGGLMSINSNTVNFNVTGGASGGTYTVTESVYATPAPTVSSATHPDQSVWYKSNSPAFSWSGTGEYSYIFDQNPGTVPAGSVNTKNTSVSFQNKTDGIWYFHVRALDDNGWSATTTFRVQIDATAPSSIEVVTDPKVNSDKRPMVSFNAVDAASGIDHYEIKLDKDEFRAATSPYTPPSLNSGDHVFTVRAYDKAGNMIEGSAKINIRINPSAVNLFGIPVPSCLAFIVLLAIISILGFLVFWRFFFSRKIS